MNQGDALEHNFSAIHSALMFPITHLLPGAALSQVGHFAFLTCILRLYSQLFVKSFETDLLTVSALDDSENHAEHLVSTVQGFCSLLSSRGHSRRECVL